MSSPAASAPTAPVRTVLLMEQHVGHRAYYLNLRRFLDQDARLAPLWVEVDYRHPFAPLARIAPLNRLAATWAARRQVQRRLRQGPYDVALANTQVPAALALREVRRRPYVLVTDITPRQYDELAQEYGHEPDGSRSPLARWKTAVNRRLFQGAAQNIVWSPWVRDSLINDYAVPGERVVVIPPGIDTTLWSPAAKKGGDGAVRILFTGGDFQRKGGTELLEAFRRLPHGAAELHLVTQADLPAAENIHVYHGLSPNSPALIALYRSADIFALPSRAEAFGIAAIEAGAVGLPVIVSHSGGLASTVEHEVGGYLVDAHSVDELAQRLQALVGDAELRQRMGQANRRRVLARFDAATNARRIADILVAVGTR